MPDEGVNLPFGIARQVVVVEQDAVVCTENLDTDIEVMKSAKDRR